MKFLYRDSASHILLLMLGILFFNLPHYAQAVVIERINTTFDGNQTVGNLNPFFIAISESGRYVSFSTSVPDLVADDKDAAQEAFIYDHDTRTIRLASYTINEVPYSESIGGDGISVSSDGRFVAYATLEPNLVAGDTNNKRDVFVSDLVTGVTERVSVDSAGGQSNGDSDRVSMSKDGRYITFLSYATNLVPGDTNGFNDIFIHDRVNGITNRISYGSDGAQANGGSYNPSISADGQSIAFISYATNLVPNDTNEVDDIFVYDVSTAVTERVSVSSDGEQGNNFSGRQPGIISINADGRYVGFNSLASNLVDGDTNEKEDLFFFDRNLKLTESINQASVSSLSADGRFVVFWSGSLAQVRVFDRTTGQLATVSQNANNAIGNGESLAAVISGNGQYIVFYSKASNLIANDTNGFIDLFLAENPLFNHPPKFIQISNQTVNEGEPLEFTVTASDPDGDSFTLSVINLPEGAIFNPQTGVFSWVPKYTQAGTYEDVQFIATDSGIPSAIGSESVTLIVNNVEQQEMTLSAIKDSTLLNGAKNQNEGQNPALNLGDKRRQLVGFNTDNLDTSNVTRAGLILTINSVSDLANQWGAIGRYVGAYPVSSVWEEGNGKDIGLRNGENSRGGGSGVTWNCATDTEIENRQIDCDQNWGGGIFNPVPTDEFLHTNGLIGTVEFDVTDDFLLGTDSWLIKKIQESQGGSVIYYSKDSPETLLDISLAPRLVLTF